MPVKAREGALGRVPAKQAERFPQVLRLSRRRGFRCKLLLTAKCLTKQGQIVYNIARIIRKYT